MAGDVAAHVVMDSADVVAFLDRAPLFPGHTLVVPRGHVETLVDVPVAGLEPLWTAVQRIAGAVVSALDAHGS
ncbi:MAG: HIT domain-containing protein, partial [Actinobacteria bacterium]|nr:HIT domain-containing protein [Actinomycetota bacterium]